MYAKNIYLHYKYKKVDPQTFGFIVFVKEAIHQFGDWSVFLRESLKIAWYVFL